MSEMLKHLSQYHNLLFTGKCGTQFKIEATECDNSQLQFFPDSGTCIDPSLPRTHELRVYEVDSSGYKGLSGQFSAPQEIEKFYDVELNLLIMLTTHNEFLKMKEVHGIFVDAVLTDESDHLVFCSFWGNDTSIRELQAVLTLGHQEGGLTDFNLNRADHKTFVKIENIDLLGQMTGRVQTPILGEMVNCWLYHKSIQSPDLSNNRAILIHRENDAKNVWEMIKHICPVPLLDHWDKVLMPILKNTGMIKSLSGLNMNGTSIAIDESRFAGIVHEECNAGNLTIDEGV